MIFIFLKLILFAVIGYLISLGVKSQRKTKASNNDEKVIKQMLSENYFGEFQSEMDLASSIKGLKIQNQRHMPNIKPKFYFNLSNQTAKEDIVLFLQSLPSNFIANVPALKISIEDSSLKDIYFYKIDNVFQLGYKERNVVYGLGTIGFGELADRIFHESKAYNFQNVGVESLQFSA